MPPIRGLRRTGKQGKILGVLTRTTLAVDTTMTTVSPFVDYTLTAPTRQLWNPNKPPTIKKNTVLVDPVNYTVDYINGKVTFLVANLVTDIIAVNLIEHMTVQEVGDLFNWTLDVKFDLADVTAFQDTFHQRLAMFRDWSGTAESHQTSGFWYSAFRDVAEFYVELFPDTGSNEHWIGAAFVDWGLKVPHAGVVDETLKFTGTGNLERVTTATP